MPIRVRLELCFVVTNKVAFRAIILEHMHTVWFSMSPFFMLSQ